MSTPQIAVQARKRPYRKNLVAVGLLLLAIGAYTIYDSNSVTYYHSTFNVLATRFYKITDNLKDAATLSGKFTEAGGRTVSFLIMSSAQFVQYQLGQGNASLYRIMNTGSASISYSFPGADTYYLVFLHGTGYVNVTQTVDFTRTYLALARFELYSGGVIVGLAFALLYWGLRPKDLLRPKTPAWSGTQFGQAQPAR